MKRNICLSNSGFAFLKTIGILFFVLLAGILIYKVSVKNTGTNTNEETSCLRILGNKIENNCMKYSVTFPFENSAFFYFEDQSLCQAENANNKRGNAICLGSQNEKFKLEYIETMEQLFQDRGLIISSKKETKYNGNDAYCLTTKLPDIERHQNICVLTIKERPNFFFIITDIPNEKDMPFENIEKLMNSYKNL